MYVTIRTHKSWGLKKETLVQIYKSLIRSVIEYTGMNFMAFGKEERKELEIIQNSALRAILVKKREDGNACLKIEANIESISLRMHKLNTAFLKNATNRKNPIISDLVDNYMQTLVNYERNGYIGGATILKQNKFFLSLYKKYRTAHLVSTSGD